MENRKLDMLRAAMPYAAPEFRKSMQVILQAEELARYIHEDNEAEVRACNLETARDTVGMMESIRCFCSKPEQDMIDMILNFMRAKKMYQAYRMFAAASKDGNDNLMNDFLMSQLSSEQKDMFGQMSSMMTGNEV